MPRFHFWLAPALLLGAVCCGGARSPGPTREAEGRPPSASASAAPTAAALAPGAAGDTREVEACGALECRLFHTPEQAFATVLAEQPLVLAIGEAHAQKGKTGVLSVPRRFTEQLLPLLEGRATDLVLELWVGTGKCGAREKQVAEQQKDVTATQAETNQNEFVTLGHASKARGIEPHVLRPSCEEYEKIAAAGTNDIATMLEMIARLTADKLEKLLVERQAPTTGRMLLAYGGALHNDVTPRAGRESWSFGPRLNDVTRGRYVELDLVVPEFIGDAPAWKALPWVQHYDREQHGKKVTLFRPAPHSYALIFAAER